MSIVVILTGLSGAGKSTALFVFEEMQYYCIENVPTPMYDQLFQLINSGDERYQKAVVAVNLSEATPAIEAAKRQPGLLVRVIALTATIEELLSRYKLTRHAHPLQTTGATLFQAIKNEIEIFNDCHGNFDMVIDTTTLSVAQLRGKLFTTFLEKASDSMTLELVSFGYKYGVPADVDLVIDTRILPNPFWVEELRKKTGLDQEVVQYVFDNDIAREFLNYLEMEIRFYLPFFIKESRPFYTIGIGCTGGQHRSVAVAEYAAKLFKGIVKTNVHHRDINFGSKSKHGS